MTFDELCIGIPSSKQVAHACIWSKHSRTLFLSRAFVQGEIYV